MTKIIERGMIFNSEMVRALLDGRKTQTRRIMKPQPEPCQLAKGGHWWSSNVFKTMLHIEEEMQNGKGGWKGLAGDACPFGAVADRIWVRETFADVNTESGPAFTYRADDGLTFCLDDESPVNYDRYPGKSFAMWCGDLWRGEDGHTWTPSIHMPRFASRILLEITDVRVERLNDIRQEDAQAEGVQPAGDLLPDYPDTYLTPAGDFATAKVAFQRLWESIYGADSWQANPWVWVIEFKRIEGGAK